MQRIGTIFKQDLGLGSKVSSTNLDRIIYSVNYEPSDLLDYDEIMKLQKEEDREIELEKLKDEENRSKVFYLIKF